MRDQLRELGWEVRDGADGPELRPLVMIVYGRNAVHEAIRGPRTVSHVWATSNAAREPWLAESGVRVDARDRARRSRGAQAPTGIRASAPRCRSSATSRPRNCSHATRR